MQTIQEVTESESRAIPLWPWQAEPYRLWSLFDMLRHFAGNWLATLNTLTRLRWLLVFAASNDTARDEYEKNCASAAVWIQEEINSLPFSESLRRQTSRLMNELKRAADTTHAEAARVVTQFDELMFNIQSELEAHLFFVVPAERKRWFQEGDAALFGKTVADAFPDSTPEIAEAGRCLALARWTASVFHLMRALELSLHQWARQLGVSQFDAIELENWRTILNAADKTIRELEQQPKSIAKDSDLKYYSETLAQYRAIKDAWRNHVAHGRDRYDEGRALSIMNHVREFMVLLASRP